MAALIIVPCPGSILPDRLPFPEVRGRGSSLPATPGISLKSGIFYQDMPGKPTRIATPGGEFQDHPLVRRRPCHNLYDTIKNILRPEVASDFRRSRPGMTSASPESALLPGARVSWVNAR